MAALNALIEQRASPVQSARIGSLHEISLDNYSGLSSYKMDVLRERAEDSIFCEEIAAVVSRCMPLQSPLYVGQTVTIQARIKQHLSPSSDLATRLSITVAFLIGHVTVERRLGGHVASMTKR